MPFQFRKEAIEEDLNSNFPSQGQGNPPLYYSLSEVVVPTYSINNVTEGSILPSFLQTAWDFSTGHTEADNTSTTIIENPGFWKIDLEYHVNSYPSVDANVTISMTDGLSTKIIWRQNMPNTSNVRNSADGSNEFYIFVNTGESVVASSDQASAVLNVSYRQVATLNGTLVNPLGFSAA